MLLTKTLKDAATAAFRDNGRLVEMTLEDRELAAQGYEQMAKQMVGTEVGLAHLYNLERARFLRGQVSWIASKGAGFCRRDRLY